MWTLDMRVLNEKDLSHPEFSLKDCLWKDNVYNDLQLDCLSARVNYFP